MPSTRECVHLVACGHFRSRDEDGFHIIQSAVAEKMHATRKLHGSIADRMSYCWWKLYIAGIGVLDLVCCCCLDLDPMTFIRTWPIFPEDVPVVQIRTSYVKTFVSYRSTDTQDTTEIIYHAALRVVRNLYRMLEVSYSNQSRSVICLNLEMENFYELTDIGTASSCLSRSELIYR